MALDGDVRPVLHELEDLDVILGVKDGVLEMEKNTRPITLRCVSLVYFLPSLDWTDYI